MEARWWEKKGDNTVCGLCFHKCSISPGKKGYCRVRVHGEGGKLESPYLGFFSSIAVDPIEKKPLYHWRPGSMILSVGSIGCTMRCPFCQNDGIAQGKGNYQLYSFSPSALVKKIEELGLTSVAFTYNEPTLQAEYILEAAPLLQGKNIAIVLVTNGMVCAIPARELALVTAAANIDLKTFSPKNYARMGGKLENVKDTIQLMVHAGVHVELTTLVVPGLSDDEEQFFEEVTWISSLSPDIPLHISRYFPSYLYSAPPTSLTILERFAEIAKTKLRYIHIGNVR